VLLKSILAICIGASVGALLRWALSVKLNALFPRGRVQSPKVRAFVDFLVDRLNFDADYMQGLCPGAQCSEVVSQPEVAGVARKKAAVREVVQASEVAEPA